MDERLTALLDLVDVQLWVQSLDTYYWANKAYCKYMGITQEQSHNLKLSEVLCKENLKQCLLSNKEVFEAKKSVKSKEWVKDQHGEKRLLEITKVPLKVAKGKVEYVLCKAEDVTESNSLKVELDRAQTLLQAFLEGQSNLIFRISPDKKYTFANRKYATKYNCEPDELVGKSILDFIPTAKRQIVSDFVTGLTAENPVGLWETDVNGSKIQWSGKTILNEQGEIVEYQASGRDITQIKQAESKFRQAQQTFEQKVNKRTKILRKLNEALEFEIAERTKTEQLLRKRYEFEKTLLRISSRFIKDIGFEKAISEALGDIGKICNADHAYICLFTNDGTTMVNNYEWCASGVHPQQGNMKDLPCKLFPWGVTKIKNHESILIPDVSKLAAEAAAEKEKLESLGIKSLFVLPLYVTGEIIGFIALHEADQISKFWSEEDLTVLRLFAEMIENALQRDFSKHELTQSNSKLQKLLDDTVDLLSSTIGMVDSYTAGHQQNVADIAYEIAKYMGLSQDSIEGIKVAALLHDIGKLHVPTSILSKPGRLTKNEFNLIKDHTNKGYEILKKVNFPWPVAEMVLQHHERLDGSGYPAGIKGEEILPEARIIAVADVVEAMCSHRPYRPALDKELAKKDILRNRGVLYDAEVVDACLEVFFKKEKQTG